MRKPHPSLSTRTAEFSPRELPLPAPSAPPPAALPVHRAAAEKIREALLRWLEEEL
jgi:hypothetical protein